MRYLIIVLLLLPVGYGLITDDETNARLTTAWYQFGNTGNQTFGYIVPNDKSISLVSFEVSRNDSNYKNCTIRSGGVVLQSGIFSDYNCSFSPYYNLTEGVSYKLYIEYASGAKFDDAHTFDPPTIVGTNVNITPSDPGTLMSVFTYKNTVTNPQNISIEPSNATISDDLNCSYDYIDIEGHAFGGAEFIWYNSTGLTGFSNQVLVSSNLTADSQWTCSVRVNDTYNWSDWTNSSTITIGDDENPSISDCYTSANETQQNTALNLCCNATDDNYLAVNYPKFRVINPNGNDFNYTYSSASGDIYCKSFVFSVVGTYQWTQAVVRDGNSNENITDVNINITVNPMEGGGGGSGPVVIGACGLGIYKPNTKEIYMFGDSGERSYEMTFYNNLSTEQPIEFTLKGDAFQNCELQFDYMRVAGETFASNIVTCQAGYKYTGTVHVVYGNGACDTDININMDMGSAWKIWLLGIVGGYAGGVAILGFLIFMLFLAFVVAKLW